MLKFWIVGNFLYSVKFTVFLFYWSINWSIYWLIYWLCVVCCCFPTVLLALLPVFHLNQRSPLVSVTPSWFKLVLTGSSCFWLVRKQHFFGVFWAFCENSDTFRECEKITQSQKNRKHCRKCWQKTFIDTCDISVKYLLSVKFCVCVCVRVWLTTCTTVAVSCSCYSFMCFLCSSLAVWQAHTHTPVMVYSSLCDVSSNVCLHNVLRQHVEYMCELI